MTRYLLAFVLFALVGYGLIEAWPLLAGPSLTVDAPKENATFGGGIVRIDGNAKRAAHLTLNGAEMLHEKDGAFSTALTFPRGASILTLVATDRFGRRVTTTRSIFVP
jgi:uncharacterized protein YfaP (DUF2135 family)